MSTPTKVTVREAGEALIEGMRSGAVRNRKGDVYKPSAIRGYEAALRDRIYPILGPVRLSEVQRRDVQRLADEMLAEKRDASTIRNTLMPLRVIFRRAVHRGEVALNPTSGVELPAVQGKRDRIASPEEAQSLIGALPRKSDQALWAVAFYSGLRAGEMMALAWENVDLAKGVIRVERSYDPKEGVYTEPKSKAGKRAVPISAALRDHLVEHKLRSGRSEGLVFERDTNAPRRAQAIWKRAG
jgi:integrase